MSLNVPKCSIMFLLYTGTHRLEVHPMSESQQSVLNEQNNSRDSMITQASTILIVDDDEDILEGYKFIFDCEGFQSHTACNPEDALKLVSEERFSTVILDYMLPTIRGDELAEKLRAVNPDIKIVIISGYNNAEVVFRARKIKIDGVLRKPVEPEELITLVKALTNE